MANVLYWVIGGVMWIFVGLIMAFVFGFRNTLAKIVAIVGAPILLGFYIFYGLAQALGAMWDTNDD